MTPPTPIEALRTIAEAAIRKDTDTNDQWIENRRAYECAFDGPLVLKLLRVVECAQEVLLMVGVDAADIESSVAGNPGSIERLDTALADLQEKK